MIQGKSGKLDLPYSTGFTLRLAWNETYDEVNNYSIVAIRAYIYSASYGGVWRVGGSINVNNQSIVNMSWRPPTTHQTNGNVFNNYAEIVSYGGQGANPPWNSQKIYHNNDGTKSIPISANLEIYNPSVNAIRVINVSGNITLTTIPRASTLTISSSYIEHTANIVVNKAVDSFSHTISYKFGQLKGIITKKTTNPNISWFIPADFYAQIPNEKQALATLECITYKGDIEIGRKTSEVMIMADAALCAPLLNPIIKDSNILTSQLTGDENTFIRFYSDADIKVNAAAQKSSTLVEEYVICGSQRINADSGILNDIESGLFQISAKDSRGFTTYREINKNLINYTVITSNIDVKAPTTDGVMQISFDGNFFNNSFGVVNNTLQLSYRIKENQGKYSKWKIIETNLFPDKYTATATITGLNYRSSYTVQARAVDKLNTILSREQTVQTIPLFNWGKDKFNFNIPVNINGNLTVNGKPIEIKPINLYPVGSIYMSVNATSPAALFGGTWERIEARFLLGAGKPTSNSDNYFGWMSGENWTAIAGETGGQDYHQLTIDEMPSHNHKYSAPPKYFPDLEDGGDIIAEMSTTTRIRDYSSEYSGGSQKHNNMPPYLVVYMWKRIS